MKNLSANKMVALAACAAASATSSTSTTASALSTAPSTTEAGVSHWVARIARGGAGKNNQDDDNDDGNSTANKPKKSSSSNKKKKSAKSKREEKASNKTKSKTKGKSDAAGETTKKNANPLLEEIGHDDFYDVLGVTNTASEREIQKAYRKRCVQTHPDKTGGDRRAFDKVAEAYAVLSEPSKRQIYNRYGKEGLDPTSAAGSGAAFGGGGAAADMFRSMFQQQQQQRQARRNQTLRYQLEVTLEDLYFGRTRSVTVSSPYSRYHQTSNYQRQKGKQVEVNIQKGMVSGQSIVMSGEVDFNDDNSPPGDLVFILTEAPHSTFTRKGHDLAMELTITLEEALCGLRRPIRHLDGSELWIESATKTRSQKGDKTKAEHDRVHDDVDDDSSSNSGDDIPTSIPITIQTGDVQVLKGRGMPKRNRSGEFGDLYIQYRVEMPKNSNQSKSPSGNALTNDEYKELARLLSKLGETTSSKDSTTRRTNSRTGTKDEEQTRREQLPPPEIHSLAQAKASEYGTASGTVEWEHDEAGSGFHEDHGDEYHPFASSFFGGQGFGGGARTYSQSFHFGGGAGGGNPFGGNPGGDDDGNVQCQQM